MDVIVLGAGRAGQAVAFELARLGQTVTLIDDGTTCDWVERLTGVGVQVVRGTGRIVARDAVQVCSKRFQTRRIVVATGAQPRIPGALNADGHLVLAGADAKLLGEAPDSAVIVGGGTTGCELASEWVAAGCAVTLVESSTCLLPGEDHLGAAMIEDSLRERGVSLRLGTGALHTECAGAGIRTTLLSGEVVESDIVVVAIGREPNIDGLGLAEVGVEVSHRGIRVDEYCRTTIKGIYAVGEVLRGRRSVRAGYVEAITAAGHIAGLAVDPLDYDSIPRIVRSRPAMGTVGLSESAAEEWYGTACVTTSKFALVGGGEACAVVGTVKLVALVDGPVVGIHMIADAVDSVIIAAKDAYEREVSVPESVALLQRALNRADSDKALVPEAATFGREFDQGRRRIRPAPTRAHGFNRVASVRRSS